MTQISEEEIRKTSISLPDGNKLFVTVYSDENAELYLRMLCDHENLMTQNGSMKAIENTHAVLQDAYLTTTPQKAVVNPRDDSSESYSEGGLKNSTKSMS